MPEELRSPGKPAIEALREDFDRLAACFPPHEAQCLREVLALASELPAPAAGEVAACFHQATGSLPLVAQAIQACPSVLSQQRLGNQERNAETLIEALCRGNDANLEFVMPTSAVFGRAFVDAKRNFLKALGYLLDKAGPQAAPLGMRIKELAGDAVFSKLAEELLTGAILNPQNPEDLKRAAAKKLLIMWSDRLRLPIGEFQPVLLSAWRARVRVRAVFGTMIGVNEVFSLIQAECESGFVNYFARDHVTADEREAFREFLFGLSYEELGLLRAYMEEHGLSVITPQQVNAVIPNPLLPRQSGDPSPEQIYGSYCRRRIRAEYRAIAGSPGPRKTAEGYLMESLLRESVR
jgi:hypothetical protein